MAIRKPTSKKLLLQIQCKNGHHPKDHIHKQWNRKGQEFRECDACDAFLGFTGRTR